MRITPQPQVNKTAPNKRANRWDEIGDIASPFPGEPDADQFGFWFNYFWAEARLKPGLSDAEKAKLTEVFFRVFQGTAGNFTVIPTFAGQEDSIKESILRQVLLIGFKRVAIEPPPPAAYKSAGGRFTSSLPLKAEDAATLNWEHAIIYTQTHKQYSGQRKMQIGFRSDTRSYDDLVMCKGFNARARQDGWVHTCFAFNQRWHPFHNPVYSTSMFLRLGATNKDACLQTVVSSGANFRDVVHFPILNDYGNNFRARSTSGHFLAVKPAEMWTEEDIQLAAKDRMKAKVVKGTGPGIDHIEKDNHIHVFHPTGLKGFNTADYFGGADKFPERSMEEIPLANLLADVHFIQKWWYNPAERQIVLYEVEFSPIRWVPSEQAVQNLLGFDGMQALKGVIESEMTAAKNRAQDVLPNGIAYKQYQLNKDKLLTAGEKEDVYRELAEYIKTVPNNKQGKYPTNGKLEKAAVIVKLPHLRTKIDGVPTTEWADLRNEAIRRMT